ncbi:hypothetical protein Psuf_033180 [Phytohabitans suffuscus]|uniref:Serine-tRNA synthetase type1 N-terminal domain-containing protein n=1 Tax=Phytohabitans suffuscus TaxID=624315 RepID=A0A6F8YIP8_9ACTN|nr:hypothetical protein Psuf_033180 [Phytohabitans suffuscus]
MIDLRLLRDDPEAVRASQRLRGESESVVDQLLNADEERRTAMRSFESLRAEQKVLGKQVSQAKGEEKAALLARTKELSAEVKAAEAAANQAEQALRQAQLAVPNVVEQGAPGGGEDDFVVLREVGQKPDLDSPRDHLELGEALGAIDMERGAKVSGSRFYFLTGVGALLELGLLQLAIAQAVEYGFTPAIPPVLLKPESMEGTGFLGAHASEVYRLEADDLFLVGTSEAPLAAYHSGEILDLDGPGGTRDGRPASAARPARTARTCAGSCGCTSSTRWRCSASAGPKRRTTSTCGCWPGRRRCWPRSRCRTG